MCSEARRPCARVAKRSFAKAAMMAYKSASVCKAHVSQHVVDNFGELG
jgi:hypothetical protein